MYVSDDTTAVTSSTSNSSSSSLANNSSSSPFFSNLVASIMEKQNDTLSVLKKTLGLKNTQVIKSFSQSYQSSISYRFQRNTSSLLSNISGYFDSSKQLNSSFAILEKWMSYQNANQKTLIDYLMDNSEEQPEATSGIIGDIFGAQLEVQNTLSAIKSSSAASGSTYISSALTAIDMEVDMFGSDSFFGSINMEVKIQKIESMAVDTCSEDQLVENGGDMIEFQGQYVNINVFLRYMDPIVLDLAGDGLDLRSIEDGVVYDIKGDGSEVQTGFVQGDDALLFFDSDGNGYCSSGTELFGNQEGDANGFAELSKYDENNDGVINSDDSVYKDLKVWNDLNGDGKSQVDEIRTLEEAGVSELSLEYEDTSIENAGNVITQQGTFTRNDGTSGYMVDVDFQYSEYTIFDY